VGQANVDPAKWVYNRRSFANLKGDSGQGERRRGKKLRRQLDGSPKGVRG